MPNESKKSKISTNEICLNCISRCNSYNWKLFIKIIKKKTFRTYNLLILGTPLYKGNWSEIVEKSKHEASIYLKYKMVITEIIYILIFSLSCILCRIHFYWKICMISRMYNINILDPKLWHAWQGYRRKYEI